MKEALDEIKAGLKTPDTPFGVDLALPQVGGNGMRAPPCSSYQILSRVNSEEDEQRLHFGRSGGVDRSNHCSQAGNLHQCSRWHALLLLTENDITDRSVTVPPKHIVDKLHAANILYMNMVGHPKHAKKALDVCCFFVELWKPN